MTGTLWCAAFAVLGLLLMLGGRNSRHRRGLGGGRTISLDRLTLTSRRYGLTGRPDRLIRQGGVIIPEEWKSARTLKPWHGVQMGAYFLLIEDQLKVSPPYGFIVCGDGTRHRIENTTELRAWVLDLAGRIRLARANLAQSIVVAPNRGQCLPCGMRGHCAQARI